MKKIYIILCLLLIVTGMYARELIHAYYGDYTDIVRLVFVMQTNVHYNTLQDTDNRAFYINIENARARNALLPMDFSTCNLIDGVTYETSGQNLRININASTIYYAETFNLRERNTLPLSMQASGHTASQTNMVYKIVVDIFRQREPWNLQSARNYITFYDTVGYTERANALRRRLNRGEFGTDTPPPQNTQTFTPPPPPPPPPAQPIDTNFSLTDPLLYLKPDVTHLNDAQRNWVNEAFRLYDIFKSIHITIEQARHILNLYDQQRTVDITFVETMSVNYNNLSNLNITINEIRLQYQNLLQRITFASNTQIQYTHNMIHHILATLDTYQNSVENLQNEYNSRINR